jgi:hypothetical protein
MLSALVEAFPHLQWSETCAFTLLDALEALSRHVVYGHKVRIDSDARCEPLWLPACDFVLDTLSGREQLTSVLLGATQLLVEGVLCVCVCVCVEACACVCVCVCVCRCPATELTAIAGRWFIHAATKAPAEVRSLLQVRCQGFLH